MQADDGEEELVSLVCRLLRRLLDELLPLREGAEVVSNLVEAVWVVSFPRLSFCRSREKGYAHAGRQSAGCLKRWFSACERESVRRSSWLGREQHFGARAERLDSQDVRLPLT